MARSRYREVVDRLAAEIRAGRLTPATRLPTHRELAQSHHLALATASRVYAELEAMGLVVGEVGRGTFVRDLSYLQNSTVDQLPAVPGATELSFNEPVLEGQADVLRSTLRQLASSGDLDALLRYAPYGGRPHERAVVARHLGRRHLNLGAERVLVTSGAQHGLAVTFLALLKPGDVVAVDALTYPGFKVLASTLRIELAPLPVSSHGTDLDALDRLCATRRVRAVYAMPTIHNPLSYVMSLGDRRRLVAIARKHELLVVEDEAYAYLAGDAPEPVAALAPERTIFVSSLSKSVATGLRFGFLVAPSELVAPIESAIRATVWNVAAALCAIACRWMEDGTVAELEARKRKEAAMRQGMAAKALAGIRVVSHSSSYLLWVPLGEDQRADRVSVELRRRGIAVATADAFATTAHVPHAVRIAMGSVTRRVLKEALVAVGDVIRADVS